MNSIVKSLKVTSGKIRLDPQVPTKLLEANPKRCKVNIRLLRDLLFTTTNEISEESGVILDEVDYTYRKRFTLIEESFGGIYLGEIWVTNHKSTSDSWIEFTEFSFE